MRRSLLKGGSVAIDRETDILVKTSGWPTAIYLTGIDVVVKEEVSGNVIWSSVGEGSMPYGTITLQNTDIRITAKRMKTITFSYGITEVKRFRVDQKCNLTSCFIDGSYLTSVVDFNVDNVETVNRLFYNCSNLEYIEPFYIKEKAKFNEAFYFCKKLTTCPVLNIEVASTMANCFSGTGLTSLTNIEGKELQATVVGSLFSYTPLTSISNLIFTNAEEVSLTYGSEVTSISNISCPKATKLFLFQNLKLVSVTDINAPLLTQLSFANNMVMTTLSNITTHPDGLMNGESMYAYCNGLTSVPLLNYYNMTDCRSMFQGCVNLVDFSNLNVFAVRRAGNMFDGCTAITTLPNINYGSVIEAENMFRNCINLAGNISITFGGVGYATSIFYGCSKIVRANLYFHFSNFLFLPSAFVGCTELEFVEILILGVSEYTMSLNSAFQGCVKLVTVTLPAAATSCDYQSAFEGCTSLASIPTGMGSVGDFRGTFSNCTSLTEVRNRTFKSLLFSSYQQQMASLSGTFSNSGLVTAENLTFIGGVTSGYEPNHFTIGNLFYGCTNLENVSNITIDTGANKNVIFTINDNFINCPKLTSLIPLTINNTGDIDCMRSYNVANYAGIETYNNEVNFTWAKQIVEFNTNPTIKTINFNIGTLDTESFYGGIGLAGFSNCPELESLTIINPNRYALEGINMYNGNWYTWLPFLDNLPKLTYLRIEGLSRTTIIPSTITDNTMIEQILDDIVDMTGQNRQTLTLGEARIAAADPVKIQAVRDKNWEIQ